MVVLLVLVHLVVEAVVALLVVDPHTLGEEELALAPEVDSLEPGLGVGGGQGATQQQQRGPQGDTAGWGHIASHHTSHHHSGFYWFKMTALGRFWGDSDD